jgi:hypothetical protein
MDTPKLRCVTMAVTMRCPVCGDTFVPIGRQEYCTDACRMVAYRRRQLTARAIPQLPPAGSRVPITVYECDDCGTRQVGVQRCRECGIFGRRVGLGGACPHCDEPVAVVELIGPQVRL